MPIRSPSEITHFARQPIFIHGIPRLKRQAVPSKAAASEVQYPSGQYPLLSRPGSSRKWSIFRRTTVDINLLDNMNPSNLAKVAGKRKCKGVTSREVKEQSLR